MLETISVDPRLLSKNPWNTNIVSPDNEAKLDASLKRLGVFKPILCRELNDGSLQIIGGEHRAESAVRLGHDSVPVINLGKMTDKRAKEIMLVDNGRYGDDDALRLADLLTEMGDIEDMAAFMPYSDADLASIFSSTSIELDELGIDDDESLPGSMPSEKAKPTHQIMRFKVAIEDVELVSRLIESVMRTQKYTEDDSLTNAGHALVHLCNQQPDRGIE